MPLHKVLYRVFNIFIFKIGYIPVLVITLHKTMRMFHLMAILLLPSSVCWHLKIISTELHTLVAHNNQSIPILTKTMYCIYKII